MGNEEFISKEFTMAIENFLATKEQNLSSSLSFPVIVIRTLVEIYGELEIINPYLNKNISGQNGFDDNIMKYGFSKEKLEDFKKCFNSFWYTSKQRPNIFLVKIEQYLIDMFFLKKKKLGLKDDEENNFKKLLCLSTNEYLSDYTNYYLQDKACLDYYYARQNYISEHTFDLSPIKKTTLFIDAYLLLGYTVEEISKMNSEELEEANHKVYAFFKIDENDKNKRDLLIDAVNYYKKYGNRLSSGNGYVDLLLLVSVVVTIVLTLFIVAIRIS